MDLTAFFLGALFVIIPFYAGLLAFGVPLFRRHPQATLALVIGMSLYFLFDGFLDSAELGVTQGYLGGIQPFVLVGAFAATFVILTFAKRNADQTWPLWVVAVGISIHSFSEASDVSSSVSLYFANLGLVAPTVATFLVHKFLEGFVLVAAAIAAGALRFTKVLAAGIPMVVFAVSGSVAGATSTLGLSPFIASGVGGWMFVTLGLALQMDRRTKPYLLALVVIGFVIVYSATLYHYTVVVPG